MAREAEMANVASDMIDADARLAASIALHPAASSGPAGMTAVGFMRNSVDAVCGWKDGGLTFEQIADKLTELGMPATGRHVQRVLAAIRPKADPERTRAVARAMGVEMLRRAAGSPPAAAPMSAPLPIPRLEIPEQSKVLATSAAATRRAVAADHPAAATGPRQAALPGIAGGEPVGAAPTPRHLAKRREAPRPFIQSEDPVLPITLQSLAGAAPTKLAPIAGEDDDIWDTWGKGAPRPVSYGEMRRLLWADVNGPKRTNYVTAASGASFRVEPRMQSAIFTGEISNWEAFMAKLDELT